MDATRNNPTETTMKTFSQIVNTAVAAVNHLGESITTADAKRAVLDVLRADGDAMPARSIWLPAADAVLEAVYIDALTA